MGSRLIPYFSTGLLYRGLYLWAVRLRSLELRGFKSFADPVKLPFTARLTGIVGPNGCGKSNIADALRWILGEQKGRLLRIEKADNLIFNGTQRRKPLPFAEVSLEVEDFSPELPRLVFTRRVYRDGESEYLLNGAPARMKDFLTYFWQVHISPQSILDGGQVEALIQDRGGARRALLEALAGIERYHHHKKEALAQLEKTTQALAQIESLLNELETQAQELSRQAEKVKTYQDLRTAYRDLLSAWISQELQVIKQAQLREAQQYAQQEAALQTLQETLMQLERRIQALEQQSNPEAYATLEATYKHLQRQWEALLRDESTLQERKKHLQQQLSDYKEEASHRQRQEQELLAEEARLRSKKDEAQQTLLQLQESLSDLQRQQKAAETHLQQAQEALKHCQQEQEKAARQLRQLQQQLQTLQASLPPLREQIQAYQQKENELQKRLDELAAEQDSQRSTLGSLAAQREAAEKRLQSLRSQHAALEAQKNHLLACLRRSEARYHALISERQALEALLSQAAGWPSFIGRLREKVPFWRTEDIFFASEADLPLLSFLLRLEPPTLWVLSAADAEALHDLLEEQQEGVFCVRIYTPTDSTAPTGRWADRIETLPEFAGLAQQLWGDIVVSEEPGPGRTLHPSGKLLWLSDGRAYHLSPAHTAHIGLPHRIQRLTAEAQRWNLHITTLKQLVEALAQEQERLPLVYWQQTAQQAEQQQRLLEKHLATLTAREEETQHQLTHTQAALQRLLAQEKSLQEQLAALLPAEKAAQTQAEATTQQVEAHRLQLEGLQKQTHTLQKTLQEKRLQLLQAENEYKNAERAYKLTFQQIEEVRQRLHWLESRQRDLARQEQETEERLTQLMQEKERAHAEKQSVAERLEALQAAWRETETQLMQLRAQYQKQLEERESLREAQARSKARQADLAQKQALLLQRLSVELELSEADLPPSPSPRLKAELVEAQLSDLKQALQNLGPLNFEAAAALEALHARQTQLLTQKTDIQETLKRLRHLIQSLDREAQERFLQTFEAVRARFMELFQSLFAEGDSCDLVLLQPDSPLTSEIDIIARPKGKRPLSLQQLSGGEKALTALALLFGTFAVQPTALCVLDEVDAPLDDANAQKFGRLLQRFSQHIPLLVVTHNKTTMAHCEVLFGVTMPEPGVSAVLGVELQVAPAAAPAA